MKTITLPKVYVRSVSAKEPFVCRIYGGGVGVRSHLADCWVLYVFCALRGRYGEDHYVAEDLLLLDDN